MAIVIQCICNMQCIFASTNDFYVFRYTFFYIVLFAYVYFCIGPGITFVVADVQRVLPFLLNLFCVCLFLFDFLFSFSLSVPMCLCKCYCIIFAMFMVVFALHFANCTKNEEEEEAEIIRQTGVK